MNSIIDESDDEPLLYIGSMRNDHKFCSQYYIEIISCVIICMFITMIITGGIFFEKQLLLSPTFNKGCDKQSETGNSCSIYNLETIVLCNLEKPVYNKYHNFSFLYTALSKRSIITFAFARGWRWYLDDISIYDVLDKTELIINSGFESGKLDEYCVCDSTRDPTEVRRSIVKSGSYACYIDNFFKPVKLSQAVNTISGRNYTISFSLQSELYPNNNQVTVYMSKAFNFNEHFLLLLLKRFIIIFLIFYII
ncbi:unnamed protein product [Adineta steineri]|uniref:Uncharacterized protein n=1 Tax=Adineta steineri TaxID=433720 RepID=A0A815FTZ6_9BILA|nr:unnamed protein product [Adineta steineri]CAF1586555.1 unnamed protein product [Adineta steineri]